MPHPLTPTVPNDAWPRPSGPCRAGSWTRGPSGTVAGAFCPARRRDTGRTRLGRLRDHRPGTRTLSRVQPGHLAGVTGSRPEHSWKERETRMVDYIDRRSGEVVEDGVESATVPLRLPGGAFHREPARTPPRHRNTQGRDLHDQDHARRFEGLRPGHRGGPVMTAGRTRPAPGGLGAWRPLGSGPSALAGVKGPSRWAVAAWEPAALLEAFPSLASDAGACPVSRRLAMCQRFA